ncbi:FixH family protein [Sinorhizobium sp. RAC02]|uniref:FixH family protein n=1 Tax=Sinorhizobium sp. RAC02 TaxID=1842534 RepID=UPI0008551CFC|nr:FixH family protein [Sinorhizobium sp. RAC02]AOF93291.1 ytkA-like family protein [Sinorhizobium sp. RAC02]
MNTILSTVRIALAILLLSASTLPVFAGGADYEFQPVKTELPTGPESEFAVKIIDKRTGQSVADAVIFETRLDMAPDGMEAMTSKVDALPAEEPGVYRFKLNLSMAGGWRFKIAAKIQGEEETAQGEVILKAGD